MNTLNPLADNPVLLREFRGRMRLRRLSGTAWKIVGGCLVVVILNYYYVGLKAIHRGRVDDAVELWRDLTFVALGAIALVSPAMAATAISQEREQQTWDLLRMTRLSGAQVILGKWLARQAIPAYGIALAVPAIVACSLRGHLGATAAPDNIGFLVLNSAFFASIGLWCSSVVKRTPFATATALAIMAVICIGTPIVDAIIGSLIDSGTVQHSALGSYTLWINPFYALYILDSLFTAPPTSPLVLSASKHVVEICAGVEAAFIAIVLASLIRRYGRLAAS